ncbi:MAG: hypothetical protein HYY46_17895 [Deltaproteobacteria bacterium]|nr:hypothetical protein [Deltaproteobacteria bacterium]
MSKKVLTSASEAEVGDRRLSTVREKAERKHIVSIIRLAKGNRAQAARILGISRKTLWKKLKHLGGASSPDVTKR